MKRLSEIKESPHYSRLKNSVQYRYDRRQFWIIGGMVAFMLLMFAPLMVLEARSQDTDPANVEFLILWGMVMAGLVLYFLYRWLGIFLYIGHYTFFQARLDRPYLRHRGGAGFTVEFTGRQGNRREMQTSPMFSSQWEPILEEYNNREALMAYNEKTDRLIVIGLVNG